MSKKTTASGAAQCNKSCNKFISHPLISQRFFLIFTDVPNRVANVELALWPHFCGVLKGCVGQNERL